LTLQQFSGLGIASLHPYHARTRRARLGLGTCLASAAAAALLLTSVPVAAQTAPDMSTLRAPLHRLAARGDAATSAVEPQDLTIRIDDGTEVVTGNDYEHGVTLTNFTGGSVTIDAAGASVETKGTGAIGAVAIAVDGNATLQIGDVRTAGDSAHGIVAGSANASVNVQAGHIVTGGGNAFGIHATGYAGPVNVSAASVQTSGYYSTGIHAVSNGNVSIDVGDVLTTGDNSVGVNGQAGQRPAYDEDTGLPILSDPADLTIRADNVETHGLSSDGVIATNFTKGNTSVDVGTIKTTGDNSWGAYAGGFGNVALHAGTVETTGAGSVGLGAVSYYGNVEVSADSVVTRGDFSNGVNVLNYDPTKATSIDIGSVETHGNSSTGIYMGGAYWDNEGQDITVVADQVTTHGEGSTGVAVRSSGNITMDLGDVVVEGNRSRGVVVFGGLGDMNLTIDSIVTKGESQYGRDTAGLRINHNHGSVNATIGSIETNSNNAPAILTNGYNTNQNFTITGSLQTDGYHASAFQADIDTGSLTLDAASITTKGDASNGVKVNMRSGEVDIRTGTIETSGADSAGILVESASYDGQAHRVAVDAGSIVTQGGNSAGISVLALGASADIKAGSITTSGEYSAGVRAIAVSGVDSYGNLFGGDLNIEVGSIATTGDNAPGIDAIAYGSIAIKAENITTEGSRSIGVKAQAYGDITIDAGTVETHGYRADGILANSNVGGSTGDIKITANSVTTTGAAASGIRAEAYAGSVDIKAGSVKTSGYGADGVFAWSYMGDAKVDVGTVSTSGEGGRGITAYSGGTTTVIAGDVTTTGAGASSEFDAGGIKAVGASVVVKAGNVSTKGDYSTGIYANSNMVNDNGQVPRDISVTAASVSTEGLFSHGVVAINTARRANIDIDVGSIKTKGDYALGIYASAPAGNISVKADSVETEGKQAAGVVAVSNYGDIGIDIGTIVTKGEGAAAIYAYAGGAPKAGDSTTSIKAGSITTSGEYSSGVVAIGASEGVDFDIDVGDVSTAGTASRGVFGYALGDISVKAGTIATKGDGASGVEAVSFYGDIKVSAGSISTEGNVATGIYASTLTGDVIVDAGDISTLGDIASGVRAFSRTGDVMVTGNGDISTKGNNSYGILAFGDGSITIDNKGDVRTDGDSAHGLYALGRGGGVTTITNSGSVSVDGDYSTAIRALGSYSGGGIKIVSTGDVSATGANVGGIVGVIPRSRGGGSTAPSIDIDAGKVTVSGSPAVGILALNYWGDVRIRADEVKAEGSGFGISSMALGNIDVEVRNVESGGRGIFLSSGGGNTLTVTGNVIAKNHVAIEMGAGSGQSVLNIAKGATVIGGGKRNPADDPYTGPGNAIIIGSDSGVVINNAGTIRNVGDRYTIFVTDRYASDWTPIPGAGSAINNSGILEGNLRLTAGKDVVNNSGEFEATKDSVFGDGEDIFVNSGIVRIGSAAVTASLARAPEKGSSVTFAGLERFENSGTIDMRNGIAGDQFVLPGAFIGSGASTLAVDIGGASSDQLVIEGAASGSTNVVVATLPGKATLFAGPVSIIKVGAGSAADAFKLDKADMGFIQYNMRYDAVTGTYSLGTQVGSSAYRLAKLNEAAQAIWDKSAQAWSTHMAELRDADGAGKRLWGQMFGGVVDRDSAIDGAPLDYRQDFFGAQLGYDLGGSEGEDSAAIFGVTGGYLSSKQRFEGADERADFGALNLAGYGSYRGKRVFANLLAQYSRYWIDARGGIGTGRWSDSTGGDAYGLQGEVGVRLGSEKFFVEPVATLAWQNSSIDAIEAFSHRIDFDDNSAVTGKVGARIGAAIGKAEGTQAVLYARGNYVHAFDGKAGLLFSSGNVSQSIVTPQAGDYGEAAIGLNILSKGPVSGFIEGDATVGSGTKGGGGRVGVRFKF
jgi:outer membrane autotransporter protein